MTAFLPRPAPCLPQQAPLLGRLMRKVRVLWDQRLYKYDYSHVSPLAVLKHLPITDQFGFEWMTIVGKRVIDALENRAELELESHTAQQHVNKHKLLRELLDIGELSVAAVTHHIADALHFDGRVGAPATQAKSLQDYADLFRAFGLPPIAKDFMDDRAFAAMRIAGPNPVMLQRLKTLDERMKITNEMFRIAAPKDSLNAALAEGRLYLADYALLDGAELGTYPNGQKYLYAPLALFVITSLTVALPTTTGCTVVVRAEAEKVWPKSLLAPTASTNEFPVTVAGFWKFQRSCLA